MGRMISRYRRFRHAARMAMEPKVGGSLAGSGPLPLYYMNEFENFGDTLSRVVVEHIAGRQTVHAVGRGKLVAIGSVLHATRDADIVWGTGVHPNFLNFTIPKSVDVRAVRGPISRTYLLDQGIACPTVFGDPAILLPEVYSPKERGGGGVLFIPHVRDEGLQLGAGFRAVELGGPWQGIVDEICRSDYVVSTALHGIIVAEAYGIPACWLRVSGHQGVVKYLDYFASSGRSFDPVRSIPEALEIREEIATPDLSILAAELKASFPVELLAPTLRREQAPKI